MEQRPELFSNFGWPDYLFYLQKLPDPPNPRNQMVVPKINEPSHEMVGVRITVAYYGQNNWAPRNLLNYTHNAVKRHLRQFRS
jgi:hypothetical protein